MSASTFANSTYKDKSVTQAFLERVTGRNLDPVETTGRFTPGNHYAKMGWAGLVQKRFGGDVAAAKDWIGRVGAWEYARQAQIQRRGCFQYPGTPETFLADWRRRFEFTLADCGEMKF